MSIHLHSVFWAALGNSIYYLLATLKIVHAIREKTNVPWKTKWTPGLENVYSPKEKRGHQFSSVAQLCPTLCDSMDCSMPGLPVHHQLPEITQTHAHWVDDTIQPSHPLSSPSPPAFRFSQFRVFSNESPLCIRWPRIGVSASESDLQMNIQDWFPLGWIGWISLQSKGLSRVFSNTTVQKHQFCGAQLPL